MAQMLGMWPFQFSISRHQSRSAISDRRGLVVAMDLVPYCVFCSEGAIMGAATTARHGHHVPPFR